MQDKAKNRFPFLGEAVFALSAKRKAKSVKQRRLPAGRQVKQRTDILRFSLLFLAFHF